MTTCSRCGYQDAYCETCAHCGRDVCPACSSTLDGVPGRFCTDPCRYIMEARTSADNTETVAGFDVPASSWIGRAVAFVRRLLEGIGQLRGGQ